jgi:hypothetical protein
VKKLILELARDGKKVGPIDDVLILVNAYSTLADK